MVCAKSGLSVTAENSLLPYSMAGFPVRNIGTKSKNLAISYGKSGFSASAGNPLSPQSIAKLFEFVPTFMTDH